jgi:ATP phosphoribosyltransferase
MLRIAVPSKGTLCAPALDLLRSAGFAQRAHERALVCRDEQNDVEFVYLRPRDIPQYVAHGAIEMGITGLDHVLDREDEDPSLEIALHLGFGHSTLRFASTPGAFLDVGSLGGARIATAFPRLLRRYLDGEGVPATIFRVDGAVENSVRLGVADAIADVVASGATLAAAGLEPFGDIVASSQAVLVCSDLDQLASHMVVRRLRGVLLAREHVIVDYDVEDEKLDSTLAVASGYQAPTISPLSTPGSRAVRVLVEREKMDHTIDELCAAGARGVLVTRIETCRL